MWAVNRAAEKVTTVPMPMPTKEVRDMAWRCSSFLLNAAESAPVATPECSAFNSTEMATLVAVGRSKRASCDSRTKTMMYSW
eukprot:12546186-Heterocapsa_arctica.AAC.1